MTPLESLLSSGDNLPQTLSLLLLPFRLRIVNNRRSDARLFSLIRLRLTSFTLYIVLPTMDSPRHRRSIFSVLSSTFHHFLSLLVLILLVPLGRLWTINRHSPVTFSPFYCTLYPSWISVYPGDGIFFRPLSPALAAARPFSAAWFYYPAEDSCPPPPFFVSLSATLSQHSPEVVSSLFQVPIALGPMACAYLNPGQLPAPRLPQLRSLSLHSSTKFPDLPFGGFGAKQFLTCLSPDGPRTSLFDLPVEGGPLPPGFASSLLELAEWPSAHVLFPASSPPPDLHPDATLSVWCPDTHTHPSPQHAVTLCCGPPHAPSAASHGPTLCYRDTHTRLTENTAVWRCFPSHVPQYENLCDVFARSIEYWSGHLSQLDRASFVDAVLPAFQNLRRRHRPGVAAWRLPPHSLITNLFTLLFAVFPIPSLLLEGFGAGAYSAAVIALLAHRRSGSDPFAPHVSILLSLGGLCMPSPLFQQLVDAHSAAYHRQLKIRRLPTSHTFTYAFLIIQHVHDRVAPWRLTEVLLNYLYNRGVKVLTLHDDREAQREAAKLKNLPYDPRSQFGRYRHDYQRLVPALKTLSPSTFFANFLTPLSYGDLEAREGSLGSAYCPDLLDLLTGLLSYMGIEPPLVFAAKPEALTATLTFGCHRPPPPDLAGLFSTTMEYHESPLDFLFQSLPAKPPHSAASQAWPSSRRCCCS